MRMPWEEDKEWNNVGTSYPSVLDNIVVEVVEPKRGRWIKLDMCRGMEQYKCSVCDGATYVPEVMGQPVYNFCPNCGARMESEE